MPENCPSQNDLKRLLLDEPGTEAVAEHLNSCEACQRTAEFLTCSLEPLVQELALLLEPPELSRTTSAIPVETSESTLAGAGSGSTKQELKGCNSSDTTFARHRLLGLLGAGGMGTVCLAEHLDLGTKRAIKFLSEPRVFDVEAIQRFQREWRAIGQIEHPHLARALDCGQERHVNFLVLEYVDGVTLDEVVRQAGPLSASDTAEIGRQIAAGLAELHRHGFVHRDVKPSNVVLGRDGKVRVIDFGLACLHEGVEPGDALTGHHQLVGSPAYMAPEQFQNSRTTDPRSDLYSLGCTLLMLLAGSPPFSVRERSIWDIATDHSSPDIPSVSERRLNVPPEFADLIRRLMEPDPVERIPNATEAERQLACFTAGTNLLGIAARLNPSAITELPSDLLARIRMAADDTTTAFTRASSVNDTGRSTGKRWSITIVMVGLVLASLVLMFPPGESGTSAVTPLPETAGETFPAPVPPQVDTVPSVARSVFPARELPDLAPEKHDWIPGEPLSPAALTTSPIHVPGILSWTWETKSARGLISAIRTSFDGTRVACGSADGCLRLYGLPDLDLRKILVGHVSITSIRWVTDSVVIVSDEGGTVRLWNVEQGKVLRTWTNQQTPAWDADVSADGNQIALAGAGNRCQIRNIRDDQSQKLLRTAHSYVAAWSPTEKWLATASEQNLRMFELLDSPTDRHSWQLSRRIRSAEWNASSHTVAVVPEWGASCFLIDAKDGQISSEIPLAANSVQMCRWSPDNERLAILTRDKVVLANRSGSILSEIPLTSGTMLVFDWIDNSSILASPRYSKGVERIRLDESSSTNLGLQHYSRGATVRSGLNGAVIASGTGLFQFRESELRPFKTGSDQSEIALLGLCVTKGGNGTVLVPDHGLVRTTDELAAEWQDWGGPDSKPVDGSGHPTSDQAAVLYENGEVWIWNQGSPLTLQRKLDTITFHSHVYWSPDGTMLAASIKDRLVIWDPAKPDGGFKFDWKIVPGGERAAWSPDSKSIATSSVLGIRVFSLTTGEEIALLKGQTHYSNHGIVWSPDGRRIAAQTDSAIRIWETETWTPSLVIPVNPAFAGCRPLTWHPSGKTLLFASADGICREYDAETGQCQSTLLLLEENRFVAVTPTGELQQSTGLTDELVVVAETANGQKVLTPDEWQKRQ